MSINIDAYKMILVLPLYNDCIHCNVNISVDDKIYKLYTISFAQLYHLFLHSCTRELCSHPHGLRQVALKNFTWYIKYPK